MKVKRTKVTFLFSRKNWWFNSILYYLSYITLCALFLCEKNV